MMQELVLPSNSALVKSSVDRTSGMESRHRHNTWTLMRQKKQGAGSRPTTANVDSGTMSVDPGHHDSGGGRRELENATDAEVRARSLPADWHASDGHYQADHATGTTLEHQREAVQYSVSVYTQRKLYVDGLFGYHGFVTAAEEVDIVGELVKILTQPSVAYIAAEGRYTATLYERELRVASHSPLAFGMQEAAPTLHAVLMRAFHVGLIPTPPNVVQLNEFVHPFAGYPPHRKPPSHGSYYGVMNFVTKCKLTLNHLDCPWSPALLLLPRAIYVMHEPVLQQYKIGYSNLKSEVSTFQHGSRHTKDYRIEVLFATVDVPSVPLLRDASAMNDYSRRLMASTNPDQR